MSCITICNPTALDDSSLPDIVDLTAISDSILDLCKEHGFQIRLRKTLSDIDPVTLWATNQTNEESTTTLRDGQYTDKSVINLLIPRQPDFDFQDVLTVGALIEKDLDSGVWWMVDSVEYSIGNPSFSTHLTTWISFISDDAQNWNPGAITAGGPDEITAGGNNPTDVDPTNTCNPCVYDPSLPRDVCSNVNEPVELCGLSSDINQIINSLKLSKIRLRTNLTDITPVILNALFNTQEQSLNTLRDGALTGRNFVNIMVPKQTGFPIYTYYNTRVNVSMPGALVELDYLSNIWWMVDKCYMVSYSAKTSPYFNLDLSYSHQDPDNVTPIDISNVVLSEDPITHAVTATITGHNYTPSTLLYFNGVPVNILSISLDPNQINEICTIVCDVPLNLINTPVTILVKNVLLGNNYGAEADITGLFWRDSGQILWLDSNGNPWI